jgi:hypothetical protein
MKLSKLFISTAVLISMFNSPPANAEGNVLVGTFQFSQGNEKYCYQTIGISAEGNGFRVKRTIDPEFLGSDEGRLLEDTGGNRIEKLGNVDTYTKVTIEDDQIEVSERQEYVMGMAGHEGTIFKVKGNVLTVKNTKRFNGPISWILAHAGGERSDNFTCIYTRVN